MRYTDMFVKLTTARFRGAEGGSVYVCMGREGEGGVN